MNPLKCLFERDSIQALLVTVWLPLALSLRQSQARAMLDALMGLDLGEKLA